MVDSLFAEESRLRERWGWLMALGVAMVALGAIAVGSAVQATFLTVGVLGALLIAGGVVLAIHAFELRKQGGFVMSLFLGVLYVLAGIALISSPVLSAMTITLVMGILFVVSGVYRVISAVVKRFEHWGWYLVGGLVTLLLGLMLWLQWPVSSLYTLGVFLGVDLMLIGWTLVALAWHLHQPRVETSSRV